MGMDITEIEKFRIAQCFWGLVEDEGEANKGYSEALAMHGEKLGPKAVAKIKEIMAEERGHIDELQEILFDITGIPSEVH